MNHRRRRRVRKKIEPLSKTHPSINLRGLITIYTVVSPRSAARPRSPSRSYRALQSARRSALVRVCSRQSKYFSPDAPQHRNKAVTFTAVPFVRGRQEICPGDPLFVSAVPGATSTWPNCTISRNNGEHWKDSCTFIQRYVPLVCDIVDFPFLAFRPIRGAHTEKNLRMKSYFGNWLGSSFLFFLSLRGFDKTLRNICQK